MAEKVKEACVCNGGLKSGSQVYNYINQYFWGGEGSIERNLSN